MKTLRMIYHYSHRWVGILLGIFITIGTVHGIKRIIRLTDPTVFQHPGYLVGIDVAGFMLYILLIEKNVELSKRILCLAEKLLKYKYWDSLDELDLFHAEEYLYCKVADYKYMHRYHENEGDTKEQIFETMQMYQFEIDKAETKVNALKAKKSNCTVLDVNMPYTFKTKLLFK